MIPTDLARNLASPRWRLDNLYTIVNRDARSIPFRPNVAQVALLDGLHLRNIIIKARQRGFSSLIQLAALDQAMWNPNFSAGIIAHSLDDAAAFLKRILYAYEHLPEALRMAVPIKSRNTSVIEFANGSSIKVDTSMRSQTLQFLHVSEFGKICAKYPDKADEIISGSLPAVAPSGMVFIESTAEGREGHFYRMATEAEQHLLSGRRLSPLDFKYHFFSWYDEDAYSIDPEGVVITPEDHAYFDRLEAQARVLLPPGKRAWYVAQRGRLGPELMLREFPSTGEEAFRQSTEGRYYTAQLNRAYSERRIGSFPTLQGQPAYTFWDIGANDETAIWVMQRHQGRYRLIRYYEASGEPFSHFVAWLQGLGLVWAAHYLPHDAEHKRQQGLRNASAVEMLQELTPGWYYEIVPRVELIQTGIQQARDVFAQCEFDEAGCRQGLLHLENYRKQWDDRRGVWRDQPLHDAASNGADAFRQMAQAFRDPPPLPDQGSRFKRKAPSWRTA